MGRVIRVLHVEDDAFCRKVIADELSGHGFAVHGFAGPISLANALATDAKADIILLERGVEILTRHLRRLVRASKSAGAPSSASLVVCGKLVLNLNVSRAYWNDFDVGLTLVEYNIVYLLASNVGGCVTYRAIYDRVHYEGFIGGTGEDG